MNLVEELRSLDINEPGRWPLGFRVAAVVLIFVLASALGIWQFVVKTQVPELQRVEQDEVNLLSSFDQKQRKAANFDDYLNQLATIDRDFGTMLRQLPGRTEVDNLLEDISQTALAAGLEPRLFEPTGEIVRDFFGELPVRLRYIGNYHQLGRFVSDIAALSRIVTLHDMRITPVSVDPDNERLQLDVTAKTYRYLDEESE